MIKYCPFCKQDVEVVVDAGNDRHCAICGNVFGEQTEYRLCTGTILNGFQIERELGRGGMGIVYLARQLNLDRPVALKILPDQLAADKSFVEGFFHEARAAASLSHPNIVQAFDAGATPDGIYYFVMELIDGENLDKIITTQGAVEIDEGLDIAEKISAALAYAWDHQKLCHGDIKPENIIRKTNGEIKLADLGLAKTHSGEENPEEDEIMATPLYAPPEVIRGQREKIGYQSDMYSFGATLYHLFAGQPPFPGDDPMTVCQLQLNAQPKPLVGVDQNIPSKLSVLVDKLMEKDPAKRPADWHEVHDEIEAIIDRMEQKRIEREQRINEIRKRLQKRRIVLLCILLCAILALSCVVFIQLITRNRKSAVSPEEIPQPAPAVAYTEEELGKMTPVEREWALLYEQISSLDRDEAIRKLQEFIQKTGKDCPKDAHAILSNLEKRIQVESDTKVLRDAYDRMLKEAASRKLIKRRSEKPILSYLKYYDKANGKLRTFDSAKQLSILSNTNRSILQRYKQDLEKCLQNIKRDEEDRVKRQANYKKQVEVERIQYENDLKEQARLERELAFCDQLQRLISPLIVLPVDLRLGETRIAEMDALYKKIQNELQKDSRGWYYYLSGHMRAIYMPLPDFFEKYDLVLRNKKLFPDNMPEYYYDGISQGQIKMAMLEGKAVIGKRIPFPQMESDPYFKLLTRLISTPEIFNVLDRNGQDILLRKFAYHFYINKIKLDTIYPTFNDDVLNRFNRFNGTIGHFSYEIKALQVLDGLRKLKDPQGKILLKSWQDFEKSFGRSSTFKRNKAEIDLMNPEPPEKPAPAPAPAVKQPAKPVAKPAVKPAVKK